MLSDWKETCVKCMDGETEPYHCEYYGEPNGCNSPTYGEHPSVGNAADGNAAAMRKALVEVVKVGYPHNFQHEAPHISGYCYEITAAIDKCFAALAAPPRNCDRFKPDKALNAYCEGKGIIRPLPLWYGNEFWAFIIWLFEKAKGEAT